MRARCRLNAILLVILIAATPRARALLTFNDGKDQVFVNATYTFGYDTNVFTRQLKTGSSTQNFTFGTTYTRHAGIISVNAALGWNFGTFGQISSQNFADPSYALTFTKGTGRTTGSLNIGAQKTDQPDPVANNRAVAWDYSTGLNLRYPVNDRYYLTNGASYSSMLYTNKALFTDLGSFSDGFGVNYIYDPKLDLNANYRLGLSSTTDTNDTDHSLTVGASGSILPKLTGSFGVGYENRHSTSTGTSAESVPAADYGSMTANAALSWRYSRQFSFAGVVDKEFGTSSTDINLNTTSISLNTDMNLIRRLRTSAQICYVGTEFLGIKGAGRRDTLWQFVFNLGTAITTHVRANLAYAYMINYSNVGSASFTRQTLSLTLSADY
jgi:hypothetical protein